MQNRIKFKTIMVLALCFALLSGCTEPIRPEFDFKSGLVYVEGFVSTASNESFVRISESKLGFNGYENVFVNKAEVSFINSNTGNVVILTEDEEAGIYTPPVDFTSNVGDIWELEIVLEDGRIYKSFPETITDSVPITGIGATYYPELSYSAEHDDFVPGHSIDVDFDDPSDSENYYYWSYRTFEIKDICEACYDSHIFREGTCIPIDPYPDDPTIAPYHTYICQTDCWRIRYNQDIEIFSDRFSNGLKVVRLPVAEVLLYSKQDILVELKQFLLSASAYEYYETLKDVVNDNGGFNSPPSAALLGNMFNPNDKDEYVLGRFTAASAVTAKTFLERNHLEEEQIISGLRAEEGTWPIPVVVPPEEYVTDAPCPPESRYNTSVRPEGWQD